MKNLTDTPEGSNVSSSGSATEPSHNTDVPSPKVTVLGKRSFDLFTFEDQKRVYIQPLEAGPWLLWKYLKDIAMGCQLDEISDKKGFNSLYSVIDLVAADGTYETRHQLRLDAINNTPSIKISIETDRSAVPADINPAPFKSPTPVLVINDNGGDLLFGDSKQTPPSVKDLAASLVICQMRSLKSFKTTSQNNIIESILEHSGVTDLVIIIDVEDLRADGIDIGRRLSWEKAAADTVNNFKRDEVLKIQIEKNKWPKIKWIVRFGFVGAICLQTGSVDEKGQSNESNYLLYDPKFVEGDFQQHSPHPGAVEAAFLTGLVYNVIHDQAVSDGPHVLKESIEKGFGFARHIARLGTVQIPKSNPAETPPPGQSSFIEFPGMELKEKIELEQVAIPLTVTANWSILKSKFGLMGEKTSNIKKAIEHGSNIVRNGIEQLPKAPKINFGSIVTVDRTEIESFKKFSNRMESYLEEAIRFHAASKGGEGYQEPAQNGPLPLSMAVFGQPGSGKSFVIRNIVDKVKERMINQNGSNKYPVLSYNLSQFLDYSHLLAAFQTVRDKTVAGQVPIVIFDEFDGTLNGELGWLKFFLAPMQDGVFFDQGRSRPIGQAIFIFIGGTAPTFKEFQDDPVWILPAGIVDDAYNQVETAKAKNKAERAKKAVKKPDFVSRIMEHLNVQGYKMSSEESEDNSICIIRRAIVIRSKLDQKANGTKVFTVNDSVLVRLLETEEYQDGARSIDKIIKEATITESGTLQLSGTSS